MARTEKNTSSKNIGAKGAAISYQGLMNQIEQLQKRAQQVRETEVSNVVSNIKQQMQEHGIGIQEIQGGRAVGKKTANAAGTTGKKRGRPFGSKNKPKSADAVATKTASATGTTGKKRGRPAGSKNKPKSADAVATKTASAASATGKKRGRPAGSKNKPKSADAVATKRVSAASATGKKRGRPAGSKNKPKNIQATGAQGATQGKSRRKPAPKFMNPSTGETWTGRGRTPKWMAGKKKEQFAIAAQ